jgi:hypothetical protein
MLIRRMRFTEPHLAQVPAVTWRNMLNFSPFVEGLRYVRKDARLTATLFVKCGLGLMGTNWVILPLLGERVFPFGGMDPQRGGMLAMSLLMASRGIGALAGPLIAGWWAGRLPERLRAGILAGFIVGGAGYFLLGQAQSLWVACLTIAFAHSGGSTIWVFSTTLLQLQTDDRFRGRVFSTEFGFNMLTMSTVSYTAGVLADRRVPPATLAVYTSVAVLFAGLVWAAALRKFWPRVEVTHSEVKA